MDDNTQPSLKQSLENFVEVAENLVLSGEAALVKPLILKSLIMENLQDIANWKSYTDLQEQDDIQPDLMVKVFKCCANQLLDSKIFADQDFCYYADMLLRRSCSEVVETEEYQKLLERADAIAAIAVNTLKDGDTIDKEGRHLDSLPLLLQSFATASGKTVQGKHFTAALMDLCSDFGSCTVIRPKDGPPILAIGRDCQPYDRIEKSLGVLAFAKS